MRLGRQLFVSCVIAWCAISTIGAQTTSDSAAKPVSAPWVTRRDLLDLGIAVGATTALAPFDRRISDELAEPHWADARRLHHVAATVAFLGGDGPVTISAALVATGAALHADALEQAALHNVEAILLAAGITGVAKGVFGRALPGVQTRHAFSFGRGFHDSNGPFVSFPSGHTSAAFAMAVTISSEVSLARPDLSPRLEPLLLSGAAAVGVARVIQRVHWPSDLPLAAAIGMWSGRAVETHARNKSAAAAALRGLTIAPQSRRRSFIGWSSEAAFARH